MTTATPVPVACALPQPAGAPLTFGVDLRGWWRRTTRALRAAMVHPARPILIALGLITAVSASATIASPYLVQRAPLLLACLSPRIAFLGVIADRTPMGTYLVLGTARLALTDPLHYVLGGTLGATLRGRRHGRVQRRIRRMLDAVPGSARIATRPACCLAVLARPNGMNLMWAGNQRLNKSLVAVLDIVGTMGYLLAIRAGATALHP